MSALQRFILKTVIYSLVLIGLNLVIGRFLRTYESDDMAQEGVFFPKLRWEEYYEAEQPAEVLVLGSSHAFRSYEPQVLSQGLGDLSVFNMGSSAQSPVTSYYLLEEILQRGTPKLVIMDIYFMVFTSDEMLNNGLINWRYLHRGAAKNAFFREGFSREDQIAIRLFPAFVYRKYLEPKVKKLLGRSYLPPAKGDYLGRGFVGYADTLSMDILQQYNQFDRFQTSPSEFTERNREYLTKIAEKCREQNIPLLFTVAPIPEISVSKIRNYAEISGYFQQLADSVQVPYLDFNLERVAGLQDSTHYYDDDHMNLAGATYFSRSVIPLLKPYIQNH